MAEPCLEIERIVKMETQIDSLLPLVSCINKKLDAVLARENNMKGFIAGVAVVVGAIAAVVGFVLKAVFK
jgi:hypothetical protein